MPKGKWNREQTAKDDKQQATFDLTQKDALKKKVPVTVNIVDLYKGNYSCPFCLHSDPINKFLISTPKGYDKRLGLCPECKNKMMIKTLTSNWTPEQFADFVADYARQGFWQKCKFQVFNQRLRAIGWSYRFWKRYKELKGDSDTENYFDYIDRKQREQAQEEGWIQE